MNGWIVWGRRGGAPFEIQPCSISGRGEGGWLSAFEPNAALLEFQGCRLAYLVVFKNW